MFNDQEILSDLLQKVEDKVLADYGLDILDIRDLHTGAPVGKLNRDVFLAALVDEGALDDCESDDDTLDIESLADALLVRSLASARPSPALNRPTTQSLRRLLDSQPVVVCAYLLNRYKLSNWRKLNHRDDSWFDDMLHRIKVWEKLSKLASDPDFDQVERAFRTLAHWLLELDSKCNLHELTPVPGWFETLLDTVESIEQFETFAQEFAFIATPRIVEADKKMSVGNRMASSAYVKSWFDNPILAQRKVEIANNKRQRLYDKYGDVEIGKWIEEERIATRIANREKKKERDSRIIKGRSSRSKAAKLVNKHSAVLDSLFRTLGEVSEPTPTPKPVRPTGLPKFVKG